ncbi:Ig-like domain-containing protein [Clostridium peptidivorans]|uniref:Ig-like domain-containing protein n=1 Tax=Clostridium peptidivorans TaxID=100174 RepID=UPI000BE491D7|nr:Ig-like domain-containing protein [Clostridium peptidivorans]
MSIKKTGKIFLILVIASMITFNLPFTLNTPASGLLAANKVAAKAASAAITITSIDDINETININGSYTLPRTVKATMSDGSTKDVRVSWNPSRVTTNKADTYTHSGTVSGYSSKVKLTLTVVPITSIEDISKTVYINDSYTLPKEVSATMGDGSTKSLKVSWSPSRVTTNKAGTYTYNGTVLGYSSKVKLTLAVIGVTSIDDINETININDSYTLPTTLTATMGDGSTRDVKINWSPSRVTTNRDGTFTYNGSALGYNSKVKLTLTVKPIASISDIDGTININDSYTLPATLTATMGDGSTRDVKVNWSPSRVTTNKAGTFTYNGSVAGYNSKVKLTLTVKPIASISDIDETININDSYTLPTTLAATMEDGSTRDVKVTWSPSRVTTSKSGTFTHSGTVDGYNSKVKLTLTVKPIASIENINEKVYINDSYTLPTTLTATMYDGSTRSVKVTWSPSRPATNKAGTFTFNGTVVGYDSKVKTTLTVVGIDSIDEISEIVNLHDSYTLPTTVTAMMGDGTTKSLKVTWNPTKVATNKAGAVTYNGTVAGYTSKVKLTLIVNPITAIDARVSATANVNDVYTLPKTVIATMSDGSTKPVEVKWSPTKVNTSRAGTFTYTGTIDGYNSKINFTLNVNPVTLVSQSVNLGDNYTLPTKVTAKMSDGRTMRDVGVIWDSSVVDTSKLGTYTYTGTLNGYINKVKLTLTVKEGNPIKSVAFNTITKPTYSKVYNYGSALDATESVGKDPIIKGITLTSSQAKSIRLDINNTADTIYNALYIDKNSDGNYDKGTDQIIGQFTIVATGRFANTYNGLSDGIKVVAGDNGILLFNVYNVDGSKVKYSTKVSVRF